MFIYKVWLGRGGGGQAGTTGCTEDQRGSVNTTMGVSTSESGDGEWLHCVVIQWVMMVRVVVKGQAGFQVCGSGGEWVGR